MGDSAQPVVATDRDDPGYTRWVAVVWLGPVSVFLGPFPALGVGDAVREIDGPLRTSVIAAVAGWTSFAGFAFWRASYDLVTAASTGAFLGAAALTPQSDPVRAWLYAGTGLIMLAWWLPARALRKRSARPRP